MRRKRPIPAITAPLDDAISTLPPRFRWVRRSVFLCLILWLAVIVTWLSLHRIASRQLQSQIDSIQNQPLYPQDFHSPVPDVDNAVHYLRLAGKQFRDFAESSPDWQELHTYPLTPAAHDALSKHVANNAETLRLIRRARHSPGVDWGLVTSHYAMKADDPAPQYVRMLSRVRDLAGLLQEATFVAQANGDEAAAVEYLRDCAALSRITDEGCSVTAHAVAQGMDYAPLLDLLSVPLSSGRGATQPVRATTRPSSQQITSLISDLIDETARATRARRAYLGERAALLVTLAPTPDSFTQLEDGMLPRPDLRPPAHARLIKLALAPLDRLHAARSFRDITQAADAVVLPDWPSAKRAAPAVRAAPSPLDPPLARYTRAAGFKPWYVEYEYRITAARRLTAVLYAIRLYQRDHDKLPPNLETLVPAYLPSIPLDPFASPPAPLGYAPGASLPFVYSIHINGRDDIAAGYQPVWSDHNNWQRRDLVFIIDYHAAKPPPEPAPDTNP